MGEDKSLKRLLHTLGIVADPYEDGFWIGLISAIIALGLIISFTTILPSEVLLTQKTNELTVKAEEFSSPEIRCKGTESFLFSQKFSCETSPSTQAEEWQIKNPDYSFKTSLNRDDALSITLIDENKRNQLETSTFQEGSSLSLNSIKLYVESINGNAITISVYAMAKPRVILGASLVTLFLIAGLAAIFYNLVKVYRERGSST